MRLPSITQLVMSHYWIVFNSSKKCFHAIAMYFSNELFNLDLKFRKKLYKAKFMLWVLDISLEAIYGVILLAVWMFEKLCQTSLKKEADLTFFNLSIMCICLHIWPNFILAGKVNWLYACIDFENLTKGKIVDKQVAICHESCLLVIL